MADKSVGELIAAQSVTPTDLFVLEQNGTAKKLTGQVLENWLVSFADGHGGIQYIAKLSTSGLVDTYRITLADTTTFDFVVNNGRGITGISKTGTSGLIDTYTISYNNGTTSTFTVKNGAKGDKGDNAYVWIKYASQEPTDSSHSMGDIPDCWIGIYSGNASTAPTDWKQYKWFQIKGEKGNTGAAATLVNKSVTYQVSDSGTIIPSGSWVSSIPVVSQGKYLWTKTELQFNSGDPIVSYSVSRMGIDGTGAVSSVAGVSPDQTGNVALTASNVGALPTTGGDLTGELKMNGQPISGLNEPTEVTQAAPKGYVDKRVPLDGSVPMTGNLSMGDHRITDLAGPEAGGDAATKDYVDDSIGLKMDLLWTNASPTSQFTEQDISFINNNYKLIGMYCNRANASWVSTVNTYDFVILEIGKNHTLQHFAGIFGSVAYQTCRDINIGTNSINFGDGYYRNEYGGDKQTDNQVIIPIEIYGIK